MQNRHSMLNALIVLIAAVGMVLVAVSAAAWNDEDIGFLAFLAVLTVASEVFDLGPLANSRVSAAVVLICTAGLFSGLPGAATMALVSATTDAVVHRKSFNKVAFNLGALVTTGATYCLVTSFVAGDTEAHDWMARLGPSMIGASAAFLVNSALVSVVVGLDSGDSPLAVWSSHFRWLLPHYVVIGALAAVMALAYDRWEVGGLALILLLAGMAYLAMKQYADGIARPRMFPTGTV